jgi:glycosyltransferase involved in cell wall biosynthesis
VGTGAPPPRPATAGPVLFLVSHSSPGGVQELWVNLADGFRGRGIDARLVALYPPAPVGGQAARDSRWTHLVGGRPGSPVTLLRMLAALVRMLRRERAAAVISAMPAANVVAAVASWLAGSRTPVIITHHSPADTHNRLLRAVDGVTGGLGAVAYIVSVSRAVADSLRRRPARYVAKSRVISNALPPDLETDLGRLAEARRGRTTGRVVIALGRLAPQKNYPMLLEAARHLKDVRIEIVGSGPDEQALKRLAQDLGVDDRVTFLGHRSRAEALELLSRADVFVQPSLFEGHSLALLEAAALGIPLVVSRVPTQVEGITASDGTVCGISVALGDDAGLAGALERVVGDADAYAHWADRARILSRANSYERMVAAYASLVAEVRGRREPGPAPASAGAVR